MKRGIVFGAAMALATMLGVAQALAQCYGGVQAGMLFANTEIASTGGSIVNGLGSSGAVGGVRGGCDLRLSNSPVFLGAMGEYDWSNASFDVGGTAVATFEDQYLVAGRAGVVWHNGSKSYVLLGVKHADASYSGLLTGAKLPTSFNGLVVGGGHAIPLTNNLDLGIEGRWTDFQHEKVGTTPITFQPRELEVLATLTFHFDAFGSSSSSASPSHGSLK